MNIISKDHIFISYSHKDGLGKVGEFLEANGYNYIYDSEMSVGSDWDIRARRYISDSKCHGVVVILSRYSFVSKPVLNELEYSLRYKRPVMPVVVGSDSIRDLYELVKKITVGDDELFIAGEIFNFFRKETIYVTEKQLFENEYRAKIEKTFAGWGIVPVPKNTAIHSTYRSDFSNEGARLQQQRAMFCETDRRLFEKAINDSPGETTYILDIAGNDGGLMMQRLEGLSSKKIKCIGIDIDMNAVSRANERYGEGGVYYSYCLDCVSEDFDDVIHAIMQKHEIEAFDFVVCSFALLHLDDPFQCLKNVRRIMRKGGYIFIRDMDDKISLSYPDPDGLVEKFEAFSKTLPFTGKRDMGRFIPNMLIRASFRDITILTDEINTLNKDPDFIDTLFNVNFRFILVGLEQIHESNPDSEKALADYQWGKKAFRQLEDLFHVPGYYYRMGVMVFLARR